MLNSEQHNNDYKPDGADPATTEILVAHSSERQSELIGEQVRSDFGFKVRRTSDGITALKMIRERRPCLVIADVDLPRIDGFQLCRLINLPIDPGLDEIPVILTTAAYIDVVAEQVAHDVRAFAYVHSTDEPQTLLRLIRLALREHRENSLEPHLVKQRGRALLLSRDSTLREMAQTALSSRGWSLHTVPNEDELHRTLELGVIQTLLVDEQTLSACPEISVGSLRNDHRKLTIVILADPGDDKRYVRWMEAGADDILIKPLSPELLQEAVRHAKVKYNLRNVHDQLQEKIDELRSVSDYLDMVIDYSQEAIFSCDMDGSVKIWNKGAEKIYGYSAEEIIGKNVDEFLNPPDFKRRAGDVVKILGQRGSFAEPEVLRRNKSGDVFPVTATYSSLLNSHGEFIGFSVIERDVTPIRALEAERIKSARLRAITQTAVTANDHINTPLGVILGYSQFLKLKIAEINQTDAAALDTIQDQVHKIKGIMNKLKLMSDPIVKNYSIDGVTMFDLSKSK